MNYTKAVALARMEALDALVGALQRVKDDPAETRRIALAIFSAPDPDATIDQALDEPPTPPHPPRSSATSPERSEGPGCPAPASPSHRPPQRAAPQPTAHNAPAPPHSLRPGLVEDLRLDPALSPPPRTPPATPASRLLALSGRAP